jgi:branched-chain amino acid transport system permease protein
MVGGYIIYVSLYLAGFPLVLAMLLSIIFCVGMGVLIERLAYRPLRGASPLAVLITAIGVSYMLQALAQIIFGSAPKMLVKLKIDGALKLGELTIDYGTLITLLVSIVIMVLLSLFVKYTKVGRAMIAVSEDRDAAKLMGIDVNFIIMITFAIGSALAAVAGVFMLMKAPTLSNTLGAMPGIKAFTAAVIGGIGSIPGAMIGGILLGVVECLSLSVDAIAPYTVAIEFAILIIILLVRPSGILGKKRREKV